jgi:hypothetical protein
MTRRRRSSSKKNNKCNICNKLYASRQSLYFHNYTYHRHQVNEINIDNNVEIYHNDDNIDNDFESVINNEELKTFDEHIDNHLISNYIKKINIIKDSISSKISNLNIQDKEIKQIVEETKPPISEVNTKELISEVNTKEPISEVITKEPISETNTKEPISEIINKEPISETNTKESISKKDVVSEDKIINDAILLLNKCISNNIGISINVELSNSTITVINKLKN